MYFSLAASLFTETYLVGVVGRDFPAHGEELLRQRGVDLTGLQRQEGSTFRWVGQYDFDMNVAHTLDTRLNVFETFQPTIPEHYRDANIVFLGNIDPELQLGVLRQVRNPALTALDTMNYWINGKREALEAVVRQVDAVLINEAEIRELTGRYNVLEAARELQRMGPRHIIVKRGEYGAVLFNDEEIFVAPAYPTFEVRDTTGAGDSFAGGFLGYLDCRRSFTSAELRAAMVYGCVIASHTVEDFSVKGLLRADAASLEQRYRRLADVTRIDAPVQISPRQLITEGV